MRVALLCNNNSYTLTNSIARSINMDLFCYSRTKFSNGEIECSDSTPCCDHLVIIIGLYPDPLDSFIELLFIISSARKNGTKKITVFIPYFAFSRSCNFEYVIDLIKNMGVDKIFTLDTHVEKEHLMNIKSIPIILSEFKDRALDLIISVDNGRAAFVKELSFNMGINYAVLEKTRKYNNQCIFKSEEMFENKNILIVDDILDTGSSLVCAAKFLKNAGAKTIDSFISHMLDSTDISLDKNFQHIDTLTITDSVGNISDFVRANARILSLAKTFSKVIVESL